MEAEVTVKQMLAGPLDTAAACQLWPNCYNKAPSSTATSLSHIKEVFTTTGSGESKRKGNLYPIPFPPYFRGTSLSSLGWEGLPVSMHKCKLLHQAIWGALGQQRQRIDLATERWKHSEGQRGLITTAVYPARSQAGVKVVEEQQGTRKTEGTRGQYSWRRRSGKTSSAEQQRAGKK